MSGVKLTDKQQETLQLVAEGKVHQANMGYAAWRILGGSPTVVGRLRSLGLIELPVVGDAVAALTPAGRLALSSPEPRK